MYIKSVVEKVTLFGHIFVIFNGKLRNNYAAFRLPQYVRQKYDNINLAKGHSTTVSISVSKTDDLGSIPSAPATRKLFGFGRPHGRLFGLCAANAKGFSGGKQFQGQP